MSRERWAVMVNGKAIKILGSYDACEDWVYRMRPELWVSCDYEIELLYYA